MLRTIVNTLAVMTLTSLGIGAFASAATAQNTPVDVELQLLVDVSGSINATEFDLQRDGYVQAFQSQAIKDAITAPTDRDGNAREGQIAAQLIYWSGSNDQDIGVDWTLIDSDTAADSFATAIANATRPFSGSTNPSDAIEFGTPLFASNNFDGNSLVMDVSGDGAGSPLATQTARDAALAAGIDRINGIAIGGSSFLESFYQNSIVGGTDSFFVAASTFADFQGAIEDKIEAEITDDVVGVPIPSTMLLLSAGLAGLGLLARRRSIV
jgi:hypothetical protein